MPTALLLRQRLPERNEGLIEERPEGPTGIPKAAVFWPLFVLVYVADGITKRLAVAHLSPAHVPHEIAGEYLRFTLAYNPNAAMGLSLGSFSRVGFALFAIIVLAILGSIYRRLRVNERVQAAALALIAAGALGNLTDRLTSSLGVVDFIDVGLGDNRFWTFNVADAAVTIGAVVLILVSRHEPGKPDSPLVDRPDRGSEGS